MIISRQSVAETSENRATAAKRHLIINDPELTQTIYFENALTLKFKSKDVLLWRRDFAFAYIENEKLWIYSGLRKRSFHERRPSRKSPT